MFSSDQLSQLSELKHTIRSSRDIAQGTVRATNGRFGFVTLDDGRDAFLNPEQMEKVFPGDIVEVEVNTVEKNDKTQYEAKLEKLVKSSIKFLSGRYQVRGKGHFIATDMAQLSRWIFIPPKYRGNTKDGDYITAKVNLHPFKDGRAQAKITENFGNDKTLFIERLYSLGKHQLTTEFSKDAVEQAQQLCEQKIELKNQWEDLRDITFVTIDSASTRDMDDALAIQRNSNGWKLSVAIAAPSVDIIKGSPLDKQAKKRGQTTYFPDKPLPMLPESLSLERYSLKSHEERMSIVFECEINFDGTVDAYRFIPAIVKSHGKLSYAQVAALLEEREFQVTGALDNAANFQKMLVELQQCTSALMQYRQQHHIVIQHRPDYALYLDNNGKLENIEKLERNCAHTLVEESMLLTNRCAGEFLAQHHAGIFTQHAGFRSERRSDIETLLCEKLEQETVNTESLEEYITLIKTLQSDEKHTALLSVQQRFLEPSQLGIEAKPHFGLGFNFYSTITSPIRRYQDLYNQRVIYQILTDNKKESLDNHQLTLLKDNINNSREASSYMERWLICDYMQSQIGQSFTGTVSLLTNQGIGIRLNDTGIEGFIAGVKANKKTPDIKADKISFNNQRMELTWNETDIRLDQTIKVVLSHVDHEKKKCEFTASF